MNVRYFYGVVASGSRTAPVRLQPGKGTPMTRTKHQHPPRRRIRTPITAVLGGVVLAASVMFGTAVGPAAAAPTVAEILTAACTHYEPNPDRNAVPPRVSNCSGANLNYANLTGANLTGANLNNADLNNAYLYNASLTGADLTGAYLSANLYNANLTDANLTNAIMNYANLAGATLTGANLDGADLTGANLTGANLGGATLTGSSLIPANITVPATSPAGATVTWTNPTMPTGLTFGTCTPASGALFAVGATKVACAVTSLSYGTPTSGSGSFTVNVTPYTVAPSFINPPAGPLTAVAGIPFTHTITATGTPDPVLTATDLPTWLTLSPTGVLTGTPPAAGSFPFTITADNGVGTPATLTVTLEVAAAPAAPMFTDAGPVTLDAVAGTALIREITVTGNPTPDVTVLDAAKLPTGMTFADGVLSGTPTVAGTYTFVLQATNGVNPDLTLTVTVIVTAVPVVDPPATGSLGSLGSSFFGFGS